MLVTESGHVEESVMDLDEVLASLACQLLAGSGGDLCRGIDRSILVDRADMTDLAL